ncbi:Uncharacterised protein [Mycobacteroides abscessus subsp. abscessus]|nr:Uncharacterised protein [Mycobacteroides abscessus subsp. abscessus]
MLNSWPSILAICPSPLSSRSIPGITALESPQTKPVRLRQQRVRPG